ncbi:MAG: glycosyltransferase family 2 protein [Planctomycetes bacterium]|nr:glycosyltransferase family 2 protein [Planctomycetota bacterium]
MRAPVSVCIITKDEERNIRECLEAVAWADEIVVVDSGSTDRTVEIARAFTDKVFARDWPGHVEQKNRAIDLAANDWVLCVDADERVTPALRASVEAALERPEADGYTVPRLTHYLGRWIRHGGWYPDRKLRLFRRSRGRWGGVNPHDHVHLDGPARPLDGDLLHFSYRDLSDHLRTIDFFTTIAAREKDVRGVRWPVAGMLLRPPARFLRMYILRLGFLDGMPGFILAFLAGVYVFLKYAKLWERRRLAARGVEA